MSEPIFSALDGKGVECLGDIFISGGLEGSTACYVKNGSGADANWQFDDYATNGKFWNGYWTSTDTLTVYEVVDITPSFTITFDHNLGDYKIVSGSYNGVTVSCGC